MEKASKKKKGSLVGYFLLLLGLGIIFWALFSSWSIFSNQKEAPQVFQAQTPKILQTPKEKTQKFTNPKEIQKNIEEAVQEVVQGQLLSIFPPDFLPKLLNLISWSVFAWILILGGSKIALVGTRLIR
jgi:hypothetical protein